MHDLRIWHCRDTFVCRKECNAWHVWCDVVWCVCVWDWLSILRKRIRTLGKYKTKKKLTISVTLITLRWRYRLDHFENKIPGNSWPPHRQTSSFSHIFTSSCRSSSIAGRNVVHTTATLSVSTIISTYVHTLSLSHADNPCGLRYWKLFNNTQCSLSYGFIYMSIIYIYWAACVLLKDHLCATENFAGTCKYNTRPRAKHKTNH